MARVKVKSLARFCALCAFYEKPRHGYGLIRELEKKNGGAGEGRAR